MNSIILKGQILQLNKSKESFIYETKEGLFTIFCSIDKKCAKALNRPSFIRVHIKPGQTKNGIPFTKLQLKAIKIKPQLGEQLNIPFNEYS